MRSRDPAPGENMKSVLRAMLIVVALGLGHTNAANAALLFENYAPILRESNVAGPVYGTEFTVGAQALSVTQLGTFSVASAPMSVGIWQVSGVPAAVLVGSVDVPGSDAAPPNAGTVIQGWNFASVAPFTLLANTVYRIGAETEFRTLAWGGTYQSGSGIASVTPGHVWGPQPGLQYPGDARSGLFMAANAVVAAVPEPSSFALLALGLAALWIARRRLG
jgi:hypothetical protein